MHKSAGNVVDDMLHCLTNVLLRIEAESKLNYLTEENQLELINWDAEEYRKTLRNKH